MTRELLSHKQEVLHARYMEGLDTPFPVFHGQARHVVRTHHDGTHLSE